MEEWIKVNVLICQPFFQVVKCVFYRPVLKFLKNDDIFKKISIISEKFYVFIQNYSLELII